MSDFRVAVRYAKSIISLAKEKGKLEEMSQDMQLIQDTIKESRDLQLFLANPIVDRTVKQKALHKIFDANTSEITHSLFDILIEKGREGVLARITEEALRQYREIKGIVKAQVTTTFPLTAQLKEAFVKVVEDLSGKKAVLTENVDDSIMGGFILRVGDRQVDESISGKLRELKRSFNDYAHVQSLTN